MQMTLQRDRLETLIRILDPEDYRYIAAHDLKIESRFRRKRLEIYRRELRGIVSSAVYSYHTRLSNMNAAGMWGAYPALLWSTAASFSSIAKLWIAGTLFGLRLPLLVDVAAQRRRLEKFLTADAVSR